MIPALSLVLLSFLLGGSVGFRLGRQHANADALQDGVKIGRAVQSAHRDDWRRRWTRKGRR